MLLEVKEVSVEMPRGATFTWPSSVKRHVLETAICGGILILFSDRTTEEIHFDVARFGSILLGGETLSKYA